MLGVVRSSQRLDLILKIFSNLNNSVITPVKEDSYSDRLQMKKYQLWMYQASLLDCVNWSIIIHLKKQL